MPRYTKKRYGRKRKPIVWYNRKYTPWQVAQKAWSGVKYLKGLVNSEMFKITFNADATPSNSGSVTHLSQVAQDNTAAGRTGNSIFVRKLYGQFVITQNPSASNTKYRIMLFIDKQQVGDSTPSVTDVLEAARISSFLNPATVGRFTILNDFKFSTEDNVGEIKMRRFYHNLRHHIRYNGTASSDVQKGGIYLLLLSDQATNTPTVSYDIKLCYHDN